MARRSNVRPWHRKRHITPYLCRYSRKDTGSDNKDLHACKAWRDEHSDSAAGSPCNGCRNSRMCNAPGRAAPSPGAVCQAHGREQNVRRTEQLYTSASKHSGSHTDNLRVIGTALPLYHCRPFSAWYRTGGPECIQPQQPHLHDTLRGDDNLLLVLLHCGSLQA